MSMCHMKKSHIRNSKNLWTFYYQRLHYYFLCFSVIFIMHLPLKVFSQSHQVTGKVTSATDNYPIPGVNIVIKGTQDGTITDLDGYYSITVDQPDATLVYSFIGYESKEIKLNGRHNVDIALDEDVRGIEEVVVVGYGVQKKSDLTGAITQVKSEDIKEAAVLGIDQALQGRAAGVQVTQNSGMPGAGVSIQVRGMGTWGDSDPLYVVDGMPVEKGINFLNPADIQSIEILKDASASAIYGARAANGVILITTKKGQKGKTTVNVDYYTGLQSAWNFVDLTNANEYAQVYNQLAITRGRNPDNPIHAKKYFIQENIDSLGEGTNWQEALFREAFMHNLNVSASGGGEKSTFAVSGNYYNQEGIIINSSYERFSFRVNSEHKLGEKIKFGENFSISMSNGNEVARDHSGTAPYLSLTRDPISEVYRDKDDPLYGPDSIWDNSIYSEKPNPVGVAERTDRKRSKTPIIGNIFMDYEIVKGLTYRSNAGLNLLFHDIKSYNPLFFEDAVSKNELSKVTNRTWKNITWLWENTLTYSKNFNNKHDISLLAGYTMQESHTEDMYAIKYNTPNNDPDLRYLNIATDVLSSDVGGGATESAIISGLARLNYVFDNKYLITASVRRDGSSRFGSENKYGVFPSFSLGWKISEEKFIKSGLSFISLLKIRAGWGRIGNDKISDYPYASAVEIGTPLQNYVFGQSPQIVTGGAIVGFPNPQVKWETSEQTNIGLDVGLFRDQLNFSIDYYNKTTRDQLLALPMPDIVGLFNNPVDMKLGGDPLFNAGEVNNRGIEVMTSYRKKEGSFKYEIGFNFTYNKNEVVELGKGIEPVYAGNFKGAYISRTDVGLPIASFFGYETNGLFTEEDDTDKDGIVDNQPVYTDEAGTEQLMQPFAAPGDIKFVDQNGDNKIDLDDKTLIGSPHPDLSYGFNIGMSYWNFDLSVFFQGVYGNEIFNTTIYDLMGGNRTNYHVDILDSYQSPVYDENNNIIEEGNTSTSVPRLNGDDRNGNISELSDRYVQDGSYIRLKNMQLGYSLPSNTLTKIGIKNLRLYVGAQNLLTFTRYKGYDPEIGRKYNSYGTQQDNQVSLEMGIDYGSYPQARTFLFGINMTF